MPAFIQTLIHKFSSNLKHLFFTDAVGACVTAFLTGIVLLQFEKQFGMSRNILTVLSIIACCFAVYSFCCSIFVSEKWRPYLKVIIIANMLYCVSTIVLTLYFYNQLTILGVLYFFLECIVMIGLIFIERSVLFKTVN